MRILKGRLLTAITENDALSKQLEDVVNSTNAEIEELHVLNGDLTTQMNELSSEFQAQVLDNTALIKDNTVKDRKLTEAQETILSLVSKPLFACVPLNLLGIAV